MKKLVSLLLVFSILMLSVNMFANERKGADLIVQRTDGAQVRGELIAVKQNSLLLMDRDSGADVTVDVGDIRIVTIVKKSKFLLGAGIGASVGLISGAGYVMSTHSDQYWWDNRLGWAALYGLIGVCIGALIGGIPGLIAGTDKTIQIEGKSKTEIREILEKLHKKARIKTAQ